MHFFLLPPAPTPLLPPPLPSTTCLQPLPPLPPSTTHVWPPVLTHCHCSTTATATLLACPCAFCMGQGFFLAVLPPLHVHGVGFIFILFWLPHSLHLAWGRGYFYFISFAALPLMFCMGQVLFILFYIDRHVCIYFRQICIYFRETCMHLIHSLVNNNKFIIIWLTNK